MEIESSLPSGAAVSLKMAGNSLAGRKIEQGEMPQQALKREIEEELDAEITAGDLLTVVEHDYPTFHLSIKYKDLEAVFIGGGCRMGEGFSRRSRQIFAGILDVFQENLT